MREIVIGSKGRASLVVSSDDLAVNVGSGNLMVFATPTMVMLMEKAACNCISKYLENGETTVGTEIEIKHMAPTPIGMEVYAEAEVMSVNNREITFSVVAYDDSGLIGSGTHKRFLVFEEKFMLKALAKKNKH